MVCWDPERREAVRAMIAEVEGNPCVNLGGHDEGVYVCHRLSGLELDDESSAGISCTVRHSWPGPWPGITRA